MYIILKRRGNFANIIIFRVQMKEPTKRQKVQCTFKSQAMQSSQWLFSSVQISTFHSVLLTVVHSQAKDPPAHND